MSEYTEQAKNFLNKANATINIELVGCDIPIHWKGETAIHNHYKFTITTPMGKMKDDFWDSIHNTERGIKPTEYDILACLEIYVPDCFEDFCSEFGYDEDSRSAERIYLACLRQWSQLKKIFTEEQLEKLAEIR